MKYLALAGGLVLAFYGMRYFNVHVSQSTLSLLTGLSVAAILAGRQLEWLQKSQARKRSATMPTASARRAKATPLQTSAGTTAQSPLVITRPALGMVNFMGAEGLATLIEDHGQFNDLFPNNVHVSPKIPKCNVLFLYCALEPSGRIAGQQIYLRDAIRAAGAHIVVLASALDPELLSTPDFQQYLTKSKPLWPANIVLTLNRNGEHFGVFFRRLFHHMFAGATMPQAWVRLSPQGPAQQSDVPGTVVVLEGGHITFGQPRTNPA